MERLDVDEFVKNYPYTLDEVLKMSEDELYDKIITKCYFPAMVAVKLGLFDNYKEGTPIKNLPMNLQILYHWIPYDVSRHTTRYLTKSLI